MKTKHSAEASRVVLGIPHPARQHHAVLLQQTAAARAHSSRAESAARWVAQGWPCMSEALGSRFKPHPLPV